ncbi:MAG: alpha/beta fold hydrolase [Pseudomonadota bacterium]
MSDIAVTHIAMPDGVKLAVHQMGPEDGAPVLMLHGLFSNANTNWIKYGHAGQLAEAGYRVIMPDFRVHGESDAPHDPAAYPTDILTDDVMHLVDTLALDRFDLVGFSLGARTAAKLLTMGLRPRRTALCGMGWQGLQEWDRRRQFFIDAIDKRETVKRGDAHFFAVAFMKTQGIDPVAARLLLNSFGDIDVEALTDINTPIMVLCGSDDQDNGSAPMLAQNLAQAHYVEIPGTHMSSVTEKALGAALVDFFQE